MTITRQHPLVRQAADQDLPGITRVALANGQELCGGDPRYVGHLRRRGLFLVAELGGEVVGYGATLPVGGATMLCDLFVDPARHGAGIGRGLLDVLFDGHRDLITFSSQNPRALPLYISYGLVPRWPLLYLTGPADLTSPLQARTVSGAEAAALELTFTGLDRTADYAFWTDGPGGNGIVVEAGGEAVAAGAVNAGRLSHLAMAAGGDPAEATIAALRGLKGVAVPGPHPALRRLLAGGWRIEDFDHHMATREGLLDPLDIPSPSLA